MENNIRTMEFIGIDDWHCPVYKCIENGQLWKDINCGKGITALHTCQNSFDGEPDCPIKKDLEIVFINKYEKNPFEFEYMMLGRLEADCKYYLGYGNRYKGHLYYKDEKEHVNEMKKLYNSFPEDQKPEWLTYEQILEYERQMTISK